ncbi:hypothetical protein [Streptomyces sp. CAI-85]|uniref:hypothetical protein n=1 Tax=Streptomyces sp. CAI-85 TaxID=1472662 RepID=UPI001587CC2A|nr:hypothetical protein [Streptomyces sp. CAI-85]NUV62790.1 hypothetical protein [Streptomyces sp. CAI-85]
MSRAKRQFWKTFGTAVLTLSGLVGTYVTAESVGATWAFWIIGAGALAYASVAVVIPRAYRMSVEYTNRITKYPTLLRVNAELQERNEALSVLNEEALRERTLEYEKGVREGIGRAWGTVAALVAEVPEISRVIKDSGAVVLTARCSGEPPQPGARYLVTMRHSNAVKGVVEVRQVGHSRRSVQLLCVKPVDEDFWIRLAEKAEFEEDVSQSVQLVRYQLKDDGSEYPLSVQGVDEGSVE